MPITIRCPRCGSMQTVLDNSAQETISCACGVTLRVPRPAAPAPTPAWPGNYPAQSAPPVNPFAEHAPTTVPKPQETANPYQASTTVYPQYAYPNRSPYFGRNDPRLAGRGKRFVGAILDTMFIGGPLLVMIACSFGLDEDSEEMSVPFAFGFLLSLAVYIVMVIIHMVLVSVRGQSLAKMLLGMQIVKQETDELPGFLHGIALRAIVPGFISVLPVVGHIFNLVNLLFIFNDERQCLHDKIAGTKVLDRALMEQYASDASEPLLRPLQPWR